MRSRTDRSIRRFGCVGVAVVGGLFWGAQFLTTSLWPVDVVPSDDLANGPRWHLTLVPDSIVHGWFDGSVSWAGVGQRASVLLVAGIILGTSYWIGRLVVCRCSPLHRMRPLEQGLLSIVSGLSIQSLVTLGLGLFGGIGSRWSGPIVFGVAFGLIYAALYWLRNWTIDSLSAKGERPLASLAADLPDQTKHGPCQSLFSVLKPNRLLDRWPLSVVGLRVWRRETFQNGPCWPWMVPSLLVVGFGLLLVARAMMPPAEYDVREYHLQAPKEWSQEGRIGFMSHNIYANMPMAAEMHVILAMDWWRWGDENDAWWWGALSGKLVMACYALLTAGLVGCAVTRLCDVAAGWWAALFALSMPAMFEGAILGLNESALACFLAAGTLVVVAVLQKQEDSRTLCGAAWVGFFAGSALACKYPGLLLVVVPLGLACLFWQPHISVGRRAQQGLLFSLFALIACGPWLVKNGLWAGNPVYPLAASVFGGKTMTPEKITQWNQVHSIGVYSLDQIADSVRRLGWQWRTQSLPLVPFAWAALWMGWKRREVRWLAGGILLSLVLWWMLTHRITRFVIPALPFCYILAGIGWSNLRELFGVRIVTVVALLSIYVNATLVAGPLLGDSRLAVDLDALRHGRSSHEPNSVAWQHVRYVNTHLTPTDRLLLIGDAAAFDFEIPVGYSTTFDRSALMDVITGRPVEQWADELGRLGYTHLLVHYGEIDRLRSTYGFESRLNRRLFKEMENAGVLKIQRRGMTHGLVDLYRVSLSGPLGP